MPKTTLMLLLIISNVISPLDQYNVLQQYKVKIDHQHITVNNKTVSLYIYPHCRKSKAIKTDHCVETFHL